MTQIGRAGRTAHAGRRPGALVARAPRRWACTTDSARAEPVAENLLARHFAPADHPRPDTAWVDDMIYVPTRVGCGYLAVLLDLATRWVVGWATGATRRGARDARRLG